MLFSHTYRSFYFRQSHQIWQVYTQQSVQSTRKQPTIRNKFPEVVCNLLLTPFPPPTKHNANSQHTLIPSTGYLFRSQSHCTTSQYHQYQSLAGACSQCHWNESRCDCIEMLRLVNKINNLKELPFEIKFFHPWLAQTVVEVVVVVAGSSGTCDPSDC